MEWKFQELYVAFHLIAVIGCWCFLHSAMCIVIVSALPLAGAWKNSTFVTVSPKCLTGVFSATRLVLYLVHTVFLGALYFNLIAQIHSAKVIFLPVFCVFSGVVEHIQKQWGKTLHSGSQRLSSRTSRCCRCFIFINSVHGCFAFLFTLIFYSAFCHLFAFSSSKPVVHRDMENVQTAIKRHVVLTICPDFTLTEYVPGWQAQNIH